MAAYELCVRANATHCPTAVEVGRISRLKSATGTSRTGPAVYGRSRALSTSVSLPSVGCLGSL